MARWRHSNPDRVVALMGSLGAITGCTAFVDTERTFDRPRHEGPPRAEALGEVVSGTGGQDAFGFPVEFFGDLLLVGSAGLSTPGIQEAGGAVLLDPESRQPDVRATFHGPHPERGAGVCSGVTFLPLAGVRPPCVGVAAEGTTLVLGLGNQSVTVDGRTIAGAGAAYVLEASEGGVWSLVQELTAGPLAGENDAFGFRVALAGDVLAVSAPWDDGAGEDAGTVYVFRKGASASYALDAVVRPDLPSTGDLFGIALALEGDRLVASAPLEEGSGRGVDADPATLGATFAGAAYDFRLSEGAYRQEAYLKPTDPPGSKLFGSSLALSGSTLAVGAPGFPDGSTVYIYERAGDGWRAAGQALRPAGYQPSSFGSAVALEGNLLVVGAPNDGSASAGVRRAPPATPTEPLTASGAAHVYERAATGFEYTAYLKSEAPLALDLFGSSVAVSGDLVAIGAPAGGPPTPGGNGIRSGAVHLFRLLPPEPTD